MILRDLVEDARRQPTLASMTKVLGIAVGGSVSRNASNGAVRVDNAWVGQAEFLLESPCVDVVMRTLMPTNCTSWSASSADAACRAGPRFGTADTRTPRR